MKYINTEGESTLAQGVPKTTSKVYTINESQSMLTKLD